MAEEIDALALAEAAKTAPIPWIQRLGYMLEFVAAERAAAGIKEYVREHAREYRMLIPGKSITEGQRLPNWKLIVNTELEPDI